MDATALIAATASALLGGGAAALFTAIYRARADRGKVQADTGKTSAETEGQIVETAKGLVELVQNQLKSVNADLGDKRERLGRAELTVEQLQGSLKEAQDRTRQLSAENVVLRSSGETDAIMRDILDAAPDAMLLVNRHGVIEAANKQAERMFRYLPGQMRGVPLDELVPQRFRDQHTAHRASYMDDPRVRPMGVDLRLFGQRSDGSEFPVEIGLSPYLRVNELPKVVASVRDMTERQRG